MNKKKLIKRNKEIINNNINKMNSIIDVIRENKMYRYTMELEQTKDEEKREKLKKRIEENSNKTSAIEEFNNKLDKIDEMQYNKLFYKLKIFQKENRIRKYINKEYKKEGEEIIKEIMEMIIKGEIKTKDIEYEKGEIKGIKTIIIEEGEIKRRV